eukprot:c49960_g1_i1 orf=107-376(+)
MYSPSIADYLWTVDCCSYSINLQTLDCPQISVWQAPSLSSVYMAAWKSLVAFAPTCQHKLISLELYLWSLLTLFASSEVYFCFEFYFIF